MVLDTNIAFFQSSRSDERTVVLRNLHVDMTGTYTCEVSTEGTFETVKEMAKLTVVGECSLLKSNRMTN